MRPDFSGVRPVQSDHKLIFQEQWQAQAVALVEVLIGSGRLKSAEWAEALGAERDKQLSAGEPDSDASYYTAFLTALESIAEKNDLAVPAEVDCREREWRHAYLSTPHGKPVVLADYTWQKPTDQQ
jgi:hypothetical protein